MLTVVVPLRMDSVAVSRAPMYMSWGVMCFSMGQIHFSSHSCSGRSSAYPRSRLMAACWCVLIRPGMITLPVASIFS